MFYRQIQKPLHKTESQDVSYDHLKNIFLVTVSFDPVFKKHNPSSQLQGRISNDSWNSLESSVSTSYFVLIHPKIQKLLQLG